MTSEEIARKLRAAEAYIARGWQVFVVTAEKRPAGNCSRCAVEQHDPQDCLCLLCHSFYAATANIDRVRAMLWQVNGGMLAVRTGAVSGVVAIDAEGSDNDGFGRTGVEILDEWEHWEAGELGDTLRARTAGGGVHLLYALPAGVVVGSRNRVLPNVDIKADGGYVVTPPCGGRHWLNWTAWSASLEVPGDALLAFMTSACGNGKASAGGYRSSALSLRTADVIPAGSRYEFTRDLVYHLRRRGYDWTDAVQICEEYWRRYEQPPSGIRVADGVWYMPFTQVMYELKRVWDRVTPDVPVSLVQMAWARKVSSSSSQE